MPYRKTKKSSKAKSSYGKKKTVKVKGRQIKPYTAKKAINKMIDKKIAQNVENKVVSPVLYIRSALIATETNGGSPSVDYYQFAPASAVHGLFNIAQGFGQSDRVGNQIKLKRWVIKGSICYDPKFTISGNPVYNQGTGYIDLYFGRRVDMSQMQAGLPSFYENGAGINTPLSRVIERSFKINKDLYKIYWHRRYKIGQSFDGSTTGTNNNDYKLSRQFGFDVCKMVCKNKIVKYNDDVSPNLPQDQLLQSLTLFATFTQTGSDLLNGAGTLSHNCPVNIYSNSYIEYEDA